MVKQPHRKAVRLTLERLPTQLDDMYSDTLVRIKSQDMEDVAIAHQVMGWVTHAKRPLTIREIQHALAVEPDQSDLDEEVMVDEELLTTVCLGLITVDQTSGELRLIHYTAQNYFEKQALEAFSNPPLRIASTCLTFLAFKPCRNVDLFSSERDISALEERYALLDYAGLYWGLHAREAEEALQSQILSLLSPRATYLSSRLMIGGLKGFRGRSPQRHWGHPIAYESQVSRFHMVAYFGLENTIRKLLLDELVNSNGLTSTTDSALLIASARGDLTLVRLLLDHNANANGTSWQGYTPLQLAAGGSHLTAVMLLLDRNADVGK